MIDLSDSAVSERVSGFVPGTMSTDARVALDARMIWSALIEPGDGVAGALIASHGPRRALEIAIDESITLGAGAREITEGRRRWLPRASEAVGASAAARRAGVEAVTPEQTDWPSRVDDLGVHAPPCLWFAGRRESLRAGGAAVAIVGARAATTYGEYVVGEMVAELAGSAVAIVSGGAYGIDGMAHRAALAAGGPTVAWLAGGVDRPYPSAHRGLLEAVVASGGAVVADVPCGSAPTKWRFLARNRLIAASTDATVVIEAGWRSGSLNTAGHAAQLGRPLGAVPGPITSASSAGCHRLLREFDAQCVTGADDVREMLGLSTAAPTLFDDATGSDLTRVLDAMTSRQARLLDEIARRSGLTTERAQKALGLLQLEGRVERTENGWRTTRR